jgi:GDP-L-fucose synthase
MTKMDVRKSSNHRSAKIYVAGHTGLVGSALVRSLRGAGYHNLILRHRREMDLTDQAAVAHFFARELPEYVFLAAAKVGGILANNNYPADFINQNLAIQNNVLQQAHNTGVKRLLFLGSSCIYPKHCSQPIKEEYLLAGPLEPTNRPYAVAKIAGIEMCWAYNRQHGTRFLAVMPTNVYGEGDHYDLNTSHVLPALIRKIAGAKKRDEKTVTVWGTGTPRREFLYSDDLANACVFLMRLEDCQFDPLVDKDHSPLINIGFGEDTTIRELAEMIAGVLEFKGGFVFDTSKPDGTQRKLLDSSLLRQLGWRPSTSLRVGLERTCRSFLEREALSLGERQIDEPRYAGTRG